ncbi:hypothetical protein BDZ89DRAFT_902776, partial [Hymenopellis radicata]
MIGCKFLLTIARALNEAKESPALFGGINVIFAGDFAQLPPVGDTNLYRRLRDDYRADTKEKLLLGKLLWYSVDTVITLHEAMRQRGDSNDVFLALLSRLRRGACTKADYALLNTRLISRTNPDWTDPKWKSAPIIVSGNATKDLLNQQATHAYARKSGRPLHYYYADD